MIHPTQTSKLEIVIPSRGRASWDKQPTLSRIISAGLPVTLVVCKEEAPRYRALLTDGGRGGLGCLVRIAKCPNQGNLGAVRRWITRRLFYNERVLMLDDDLNFRSLTDELDVMGVRRMVREIADALDFVPMVGIARCGEVVDTNVVHNIGMRAAYGLDLQRLRDRVLKFNRELPVLEDVDLALKLLRSGDRTAVLQKYCWSEIRRPRRAQQYATAAKILQKAHPTLVSIKNGKVKIAWDKLNEDNSRLP